MGVIATIGVLAAIGAPKGEPTIRYERFQHGRGVYHLVTADLRSGQYAAGTVHSPRLISVWDLVGKTKPYAAITGTFFSPASQRPVADVLIDGRLVSRGSLGTAIGVDWYGEVSIFDRPFRQPVDWGEYRFGLRGTVRVVAEGVVRADPKAQRFRDKRLWGRAARTGLGLTSNGKLLLCATKSGVTLSEMGRAMRSRGAQDAVSLDGGGSTCLYYKGSLVVPPQRKLNNLFVLRPAESASGIAGVSN